MTAADDSPTPLADHPHTEVDQVAERYYDAIVEASPIFATDLGLDIRQDEYDDLSPTGQEAHYRRAMTALDELDQTVPADDIDRVTRAAMRNRLGLEAETHDNGDDLLGINGIDTGLHSIRAVYDAMPTDTPEQWQTITRRLKAVPSAIHGWLATQHASIDAGVLPARRQVRLLASQVDGWITTGGFFDTYLAGATTADGPLPDGLHSDLADAVEIAKEAYAGAAAALRTDIEAQATDEDAVGIQRYRLASREFLGSTVDLAETYRWGQEELARIEEMQRETASRIRPGANVAQAMEALDADPAYQIHGTADIPGTVALKEWMQARADEAITALDGTHFDIPAPARRIEGMIAPTHDGGVFYTGPSDDFSRPGRMWWAVPEGVDTFTTWRELTTVYHEGVPGHHLQISSAIAQHDQLNSWRRNACWTSGHGEGWALYAEWLMRDLGFMGDSGHLMGLLDGQSMRAARVVLDIGLHCGFDAPAEVGGGVWNWDKAWTFFNNHVSMDEGSARFEVNRYFGWPGQAPAYKLGERTWMELRDAVRAADPGFNLKDFHTRALALGGLPLDVLRSAILS
ncbi:DUF885 domain-containing protein [Acidipropionibacterium virtanenii]|uniref:DUF885 domain-containing protein n=1 Tax=Acidipropionibacterium virtanenii TaxID=2057246 RepID=A0A344URB6_9ACTN|nr:DUF885 domain-containing protein [Acidipropionibacterium virtanenii]AXE37814.1 hypothetical protein JS278_00622 [Acidipropionibacterium virtanenii]